MFDLDRFELVDGDRYELVGRWSGVRGRRFIRPTLTLLADGHPVRLLADLAHKPWAAEDGQSWTAAFPCRFEVSEVTEPELTVAPNITISLAAPVSRSTPGRRARTAKAPTPPVSAPEKDDRPDTRAAAAVDRGEQHELRRRLERAEAEKTRMAARMDELLGNLSEAIRARDDSRADHAQRKAELQELRRELSELASQRDTARAERDRLAGERASLQRARDEALEASRAAALARDDALAQRGTAITAQGRAESDRDAAVAAGAQAQSERDAALSVRDHALADRDAALVIRDAALAERDAALAAREDAFRERDSAGAALVGLQAQRAQESSTLGAAMVMRRAVQAPPAFRRSAPILPRALAVIVLLAAVVALLIVLRVG